MKNSTHFCRFVPSINPLITQIFVVIALALTFAFPLNAQNNSPKISIQGTLKSANGTSVPDGQYSVRFSLYDVPIGGTALWHEDTMVDVIGSIYSHYLGSVTPLNPANFGSTLYLGVKVGSYELIPRSELAYAPYSFSVAVAQKVLCSGAVGDIKYSILNPTQFAAANGNCWVPMDGRALATTDQLRIITGMTNVPDGSGLFLRAQEFSGGADNDPGRNSNTTIGTVEADDFKSHNHTENSAGNHEHSIPYDSGGGGNGGNNPMLWFTNIDDGGTFHTNGALANGYASTEFGGSHTHGINNTGGAETRPKNLNFWIYIRIN